MHTPRPYGLTVYGGELTGNDLAFIDNIAKRLTNIKTTSELHHLKLVYDLPDGGSAVLSDMGGAFRIVASKPIKTSADTPADYMAHSNIPMLYSGVITKAIIRHNQGVQMLITEQTRKRIGGYNGRYKPPKLLDLQRFVIDYHDSVQEFIPNPPSALRHTQYARQRPTWYSGSMARVMQIVGGYGRQDLDNLPDKYWERATVKLPDKVKKDIDDELKDKLLPAYTGYPPKSGQYQYDYKHRQCHGVGFDDENKPWLLSISHKGVYAMPLPIIPATTTAVFREYMEEMGDSEILSILDTFGGMPSGESFPDEQDFKAWERAGVIIKVCDTADFYQYSAYYTACGWSLNSRATEGYNTCWHYGDDGIKVGLTYNMTLALKAVADNGRVAGNQKTLPDYQAQELAKYLAKIMNELDTNTARGASIHYKLRRLTDIELYAIIGATVDDLDNLTLSPIANHTGQVRRVYQGRIYHSAKFEYQPQIKFPIAEFHGCGSFDFSKREDAPVPIKAPKCDTVIHTYFADDDLKVVKYFYDDRKYSLQTDTNFEDVMIVGSWEETSYGKTSGLMGNFYISDLDEREVASDVITYTTIIGRDLGYGNPAYATPSLLVKWGNLSRARYYSHLTKTQSTYNKSLIIGLCVPVYSRDSLLYAYQENNGGIYYTETLERKSVPDPTSYGIWTYDPIFHYMGTWGIGEPSPTTGDYVFANYNPATDYRPTKYSWFSDSGNWFGVEAGSFKDVSGIAAIYTSRNSPYGKQAGGVVIGGEPPQLVTYNKKSSTPAQSLGRVDLSITDKLVNAHKNVPDSWYFSFSPIIAGGSISYFYRDVCQNKMGDIMYSNTFEMVEGKRKCWGSSQLINGVGYDTAHYFIGVINE